MGFSKYMLAAALAVGAGSLVLPTLAADQYTGSKTGAAMDNAADRTGKALDASADVRNAKGADEETGKEVRKMLTRMVNDAYSKGDLSNFVGYLAKEDRDRLGKVEKNDTLDGRINQFRKDFKDKYGQDFDLTSDHLKDIQVYAGSDKNHVTVVTANLGKADIKTDAGKTGDMGKDLGKAASDIGKGLENKLATGSVTLNLVNEGNVLNAWRVKIPNDLSLRQLEDNLLKQITTFDEAKASWPADAGEAHKLAAQHVFHALTTSAMASEK